EKGYAAIGLEQAGRYVLVSVFSLLPNHQGFLVAGGPVSNAPHLAP
ncbi:unnamed protein product, partial [marine sediment metagenome]